MKDELEKYITEHRNEFDEHSVDEVDKLRLWSAISEALPEPEKPVIPLWKRTGFRVAASIVFLTICLFSLFIYEQGNEDFEVVNEELYEIDNHYKLLVENQIQLVKNNEHLTKQEQSDFLAYIEELDKEYGKLKSELKVGIDNQKIIEAIIQNYRKKLQLMEDLLKRSYPRKNTIDDGELIL